MALIENRSSDPTDPLEHYSLFSFCHRTFKDLPADDIDSVHNFLISTGLSNSDKLFEEAKAIVNSEVLPGGASENNNEALTKIKRNLEERRPGLGLKRARPSFCLKPDKGPPPVSLEPTLDIDKLQDPDEFFSAYYKHEFAREEIERQTGNIIGKNENNPPANLRRRRPSLFGKRASYKCKYSSAIPEDDDTIITSQETSEQDNISPSKCVSQSAIPDNDDTVIASQDTSEQNNLSVSKYVSEKHSVESHEGKSGGILDELLSRDIEDLDGDGALSLLQEHLKIPLVDLDKYLHDFSDAGNIDRMDFEEEIPVRRKALSDIQNVVNVLNDKNPAIHKQMTRNKSHSLMSSTPPKSLSVASSLLGEGKSLSKPFHFPFSSSDLDLSPAKSPTHEYLNGKSDNLGTMNEPSIHGEFNFQVEDEAKNPTCAISGSKQVIPEDSFEKFPSMKTSSIDINTRTKDSHDGLVDANQCNHVKEILHEIVSSVQPDVGNNDLARIAAQAHGLTESEKDIENIHQGASSTQPDADIVDSATENSNISQTELGMAIRFFSSSDPLFNPDKKGNEEPLAAEDQFMDGRAANAESGLEQQNEEHPEISLKGRRKTGRPRGSRERKALTRRQSLAAAGTCWNSGVRRSNRIKTRPLEYWKGERFLRGRVHESLDTVIGIKCISTPSPGGKVCRLKVTSYVSGEHKELVESVALH